MAVGMTSGLMPVIILAGVVLIVFGLIKKVKTLIHIGLIVAVLAYLANGGLAMLMSVFR